MDGIRGAVNFLGDKRIHFYLIRNKAVLRVHRDS